MLEIIEIFLYVNCRGPRVLAISPAKAYTMVHINGPNSPTIHFNTPFKFDLFCSFFKRQSLPFKKGLFRNNVFYSICCESSISCVFSFSMEPSFSNKLLYNVACWWIRHFKLISTLGNRQKRFSRSVKISKISPYYLLFLPITHKHMLFVWLYSFHFLRIHLQLKYV